MRRPLFVAAAMLTLMTASAVQQATGFPESKDGAQEVRHRVQTVERSTLGQFSTHANGRIRVNSNDCSRINAQPPTRIVGDGSSIYGWSRIGIGSYPKGLYEMTENGMVLKWSDPLIEQRTYTLQNGFLLDGVIYGQSGNAYGNDIFNEGWVTYDFATGQVLSNEDWDITTDPYMFRMVYNPNDGCLYSQGFCPGYEGGDQQKVFMKAPLSNPKDVEIISEVSGKQVLTAMCFNEIEDAIFGVNVNGDFVKMGFDGEVTVLMTLDLAPISCMAGYYAGLVYSPVEQLYYYSPTGTSTYLTTINPETNEFSVCMEIPETGQMQFLMTTDECVKDLQRPEAPVVKEISFPEGAVSGFISYDMPDKLVDGNAISGKMTAYASLDGEPYKELEATPGAELKVDYSDLSNEKHAFGLYLDYEGHKSNNLVTRIFIGNDTPKSPKNVVLASGLVSWDAVTEGANGGYIDLEDLTYTVIINGEEYGKTKETSLVIELPEQETIKEYTAKVTCESQGKTSVEASSNAIVFGKPYELPMVILPNQEQAATCTVIDNNEDGTRWTFNTDCFEFGYSFPGIENDDWLILPPFTIDDSSRHYTFSIESQSVYPNHPEEALEVYVGTQPTVEAMTDKIVDMIHPTENYMKYEKAFTVPSAGTYYVAVRCVSPSGLMGLKVRNLSVIDNNITAASPSAVESLVAKAGEKGALEAQVSFTMPSTKLDGKAIAADETVKVVVSAASETEIFGHAGEKVTANVITAQGDNRIFVTASIGEFNSPSEFVDVYTGIAIPLTPDRISADVADDMMSVSLEWNPVTEGTNGGYIVPDEVTYTVYDIYMSIFGSFTIPIAENVMENTYVYQCSEGEPQALRTLGVASFNSAGSNEMIVYTTALIGTPFALPMEEKFEGGYFNIEPWMIYTPDNNYNCNWSIGKVSDTVEIAGYENSYALTGTAPVNGKGLLGAPRFTTKGYEGADVVVEAYTGYKSADIVIGAAIAGMDGYVEIGMIPHTEADEISTYTFPLPAEFIGKDWVQIYIAPTFTRKNQSVVIPGIKAVQTSGTKVIDGDNVSVAGGKGYIVVSGCHGKKVSIYNVDGSVISQGAAGSDREIYSVAPGMYVVKAGEHSFKVLAR